MDTDDISECYKCGLEWLGDGECPRCEAGTQDEPGCPRCSNSTIYDSEAQVCYNCGYEAAESAYEPFPKADGEELLAAEDLIKHYGNTYQPSYWEEDVMNTKAYVPYKAEPYQPFLDLVEDLKKWHVKVEKTTDTGKLHTWVCKLASKGAGCDVTHMAKAFGPRVWIPDTQWATKTGYLSLVHEATHAKDFWKFGVIPFFLMQNFLPFGPSFTALLEYRAYVAGFKAEKKMYGYLLKGATQRIADALASRGYRYCFPWPKLMKKLLDRAIGD
jgi:hypothetical protein